MEWKEAILRVLKDSDEPMHYSDIADAIAEKGYRGPNELGATPASTVSAVIGTSLRGEETPFVRVTMGYYSLKNKPQPTEPINAVTETSGIINALGMFWSRSKVIWKTDPRLLGKQQQDSTVVDFGKQIGVYFLHDSQGVVYVGRAIDQPLGRRLQQHTTDRLNGRWDRFSWFGIYPVKEDASLNIAISLSNIGFDTVIATLEAVLIEGLEPRQNRHRGDNFKAVEFLQSEDPDLEVAAKKAFLFDLAAKLQLAT